ncbi:MAG TPA: spermine synthase [Opitutae bacterium]|nr:spermine synthase [Opitutae bacterium]
MKPKIKLAEVPVAGGTMMALYSHDGAFSMSVNGQELMHSEAHASERLMGTLGVEQVPLDVQPRILIGGLGLGFTLRSVIDAVGPEALIDVAELVPEVIEWNQTFLKDLNGELMGNEGVDVFADDVVNVINKAKALYDTIIVDVDNGPFAMVADSNVSLYSNTGLKRVWGALKPEGRAVFWSAKQDVAFAQRLKRVGFKVQAVPAKVHARAKRAAYMLYIADRRKGTGEHPEDLID